MGINGFERVGPEWLKSHWESSRLRSLEKGEIFEGGEREADLLVHALSN